MSNIIEQVLNSCENDKLPCKFDIFAAKEELKYLYSKLDYIRKENERLNIKLYETRGAK